MASHLRSPEAPPLAHRKNPPAPPGISASMQFATKRAHCVAQATWTTWRGGRATHVNRSSLGVPLTGMGDRHDPHPVARTQPGSSVKGSRPCRAGCANEAASGPRSLAGQGRDPMEGHDSDDGMSLRVVAPIAKPSTLFLSSLSPACLALSPPVCRPHFFASLLCPLIATPRCLPVTASALGVGVRWTSAELAFPRALAK